MSLVQSHDQRLEKYNVIKFLSEYDASFYLGVAKWKIAVIIIKNKGGKELHRLPV